MPIPVSKLLRLLLFPVLICSTAATAQTNADHEVISTAQGLSQGLVNDMIQDKEGFIWIATKGGLNRYDGYSFKVFTTDPQDSNSISSNAVSNLMEDNKGRIWAGTYDGGVNVYDKKTGHFLRITQKEGQTSGLSTNRIESAMIELPDGRVLVCPQGGGLNIISLPGGESRTYSIVAQNTPENKQALGIGKDDKGYIWVGCTDKSIYILNPATLSFELLSDGHTFTNLIERSGKYLSARASQVFFLEPVPHTPLVLIDSTGRMQPGILTAGEGGGLLIKNQFPFKPGASGNNFYDFSGLNAGANITDAGICYLKTDVKDQTIKCMLLDRSGVLWMGTLGHGIYKYRIRSDRFKPIEPNLSLQRITILNKNIIYLQGWKSVKSITAAGIKSTSPIETIVANNPATVVLQAQNGDYWVWSYSEKTILWYTAGLKLKGNYVLPVNTTSTEQLQPLIEDSRHNIWVCGSNGTLAKLDPATGIIAKFKININQYTGTTALTQSNTFYEDAQGIYWLGTEHGFARLVFKADTTAPEVKWFKNIPGNNNSLSYNYVSSFMDDPVNADYLWICTKGGGLNRMEKSTGNFIHYTTKQGLPNNVVYGVLADKAGNIWGSTNRGLFCMLAAKEKKDAQPIFRTFSTSDGLQADEFNTNAFGKLANDDLVFGGVNGINVFNPQKVLSSSYSPNVYITAIQIGNKVIAPGDETGVLKETIEQTASITLSHLQDVLTLEFSSLDFSAPQQNKYRYQLLGIDKEWVESGTRRTATYLHLPAGTYTFNVQGSNSQGIWSNKTAEIKITVLPPWWRSWWAYIIYVLLMALAIRAYLKFNVNKARLESQLNYEQLEAKRVKELDTVKTQLYTNITHEFRTPLTVILGMANQVIENPGEQFNSRMNMIVRNGRSLIKLVNEMLDLSKLETGKMPLQLTQGDVIHFLRYIVESFHSLANSQQKQLHFLTDIDTLFMEYDQEKIRQIVSNLLSNAIKFTPEKGNIYISVTENALPTENDKSTLIIKVKDTGIGIPEDQLPHIFDRFYQLDNSHTRKTEGTGIGLALTKELIRLMKGEIIVKSLPAGSPRGSEFTVSLPLRKVDAVNEIVEDDVRKSFSITVPPDGTKAEEINDDKRNENAPLILLVEDNADVVAYIASCLPDYKVAVGKDGREGFEIAVDMIPDLIITDVMMPFIDGFELITKLRGNENTSHIPVIMLTAKADIHSKIEGLQRGAEVYLEKPFNKEELLVRIQKLLEMRKHLQQHYLTKAGFNTNSTITMATPVISEEITDHKTEDAFVKKVREAVEQHLADVNFSVEQLCKLVFMSHSQLHRKLDALTGFSPNKFIRMIRLKKATVLLQNQSNSIASVALDCGYNDPGYFARIFKQEYGITPQEWRAANTGAHR
jgi:signal transduction histidine kinase/DNA-binding response OmpR family regulator/ligand-binding sensor domain-containing protein